MVRPVARADSIPREQALTVQLEPTGERMIPEHYRSTTEGYVIHLMHLATYRFALQWTDGKRVLDYGCGAGYGSAAIAEYAASVDAVDVAADAIAYARARHVRENLRFDTIDAAARLPYADASFDVVLSFQVFEHVAAPAPYLDEIRRVLVPGGTLLLVTPDRRTRLFPGQRPWNRWHLREYDARSLERELSRHFPLVEMYGMNGTPSVVGVEFRRCNRLRWLSLPLTLPVWPDRLRVALLDLVHRMRGTGAPPGPPMDFDFGVESIRIERGTSPSLNLVAVAR